jgi:hypothetical protein
MKRFLVFVVSLVGAAVISGNADAFSGMDLELTYSGAFCNAAVFGNHPVLNWMEMENNTGGNEFLLCPFVNDANSMDGETDINARIGFTGPSASAVNCSLSANLEDNSGWNFAWTATDNFGSYFEEYFTSNYVTSGRWVGTAFNCLLAPGAAVTNYGIVTNFTSASQW